VIPNRFRAVTCRTVFGLLAASGLRISEATQLVCTDIDWQHGVLNIRHTKFHQARLVPLDSTVTEQLSVYAALRDSVVKTVKCDHFFVREDGRPVTSSSFLYALQQICKQLGWKVRGDHSHHRLHDLRHTFIVRSVMQLYQQGKTIDQSIAALSIYVGHAKVTDTYWYMTGIPELMSIAGERFEHYAREVSK
jgi:integrase/recombinase XerD